MPRLVNYSDRFDGIREAVFDLTLRDGPTGISLPAVAAHLQLSTRSLQRLLSSSKHLPMLGLQWAERERRRRLLWSRRRTETAAASALADLLEDLPGGPAAAADQRVWWALVPVFEGTCDWAQAARAEHDELVEALATTIVCSGAIADALQAYERERLCALVAGTAHRILAARLTHEEGTEVVRAHVHDLVPPLADKSGDAA
jgi:AcrR family transcriptional regulator